MDSNTFYVIDTSSLINIRMFYPISIFTSFWDKLDGLALEGRLASPQTVLEELGQKDDDYLINWARSHKDKLIYTDYSEHFLQYVEEIMDRFPELIDNKSTKEQADPYVIALALEYRDNPQQKLVRYDVNVVTEESLKNKSKKTKIPEVCDYYKIPCYKMIEMAENEGWKF